MGQMVKTKQNMASLDQVFRENFIIQCNHKIIPYEIYLSDSIILQNVRQKSACDIPIY